jgi:phenylalanyl-tRNA synthetase beta chain
MKFAFSMLKDFVETSSSAVEIGDLLTMAGFELEGIEEVEGEMMLDIKVVSNRGDGLSVLGLAREVLAKQPQARPTELYQRAAARFPAADLGRSEASGFAQVVIETEDCTRFACRAFQGDFSKPAPQHIQKRLRIAGMRSLGLLVDLTNYVMLEVGQPLHAYDLDKLGGRKLVVRKAKSGEKLTTLNGDEHELNPQQMMICDADRPVGVAGVMGGLDSEVTSGTTRILLEAAHFVNTSVRRTRKQLGLSTEASYRFERSVDPEGVVAALNRFAELLAEVDSGSTLVPGVIDVYPAPPQSHLIEVSVGRASKLLGMPVTPADAKGYLERLGFIVNGEGDQLSVTGPTWRPDVVQEYDVVEEIGRVHGFDKIPEAPIQGTTTQGGVFGRELYLQQIRDKVMRLGFVQNISHSLQDVHPLDDPIGPRVGPRHPSSPEMAVLRNSLLPGLAENARRNGSKDFHLFEIGAIFGATERRTLALLSTGGRTPEHWEKEPPSKASFFTLKASINELWPGLELTDSQDARLHPTRQAQAKGLVFGQIHPDIADELDLPAETFLAEADLEALYMPEERAKSLIRISRNPAVRRDIAILIDKSVPYSQVEKAIETAGGDLLERQWLFDVYEGKGIPEGKHSLALAIQIRKFGENLTDEEANQVRDRVVQALAALGATQR